MQCPGRRVQEMFIAHKSHITLGRNRRLASAIKRDGLPTGAARPFSANLNDLVVSRRTWLR